MRSPLFTTAGELGSSTLFEASGLRCSLDRNIRPICPGLVLVGEAYPLSCAPGDNLAIHIALEKAPANSVLVVDAGAFIAGYWGEVLTVAAQAKGIAGLVMDGGVRDIAAMNKRSFPVFTRGISVQGTAKARFNSVGETIQISDCGISQGDLVVADDDGVVVIPRMHIERVINAGKERADKEALMMEKLGAGATTIELLGLQKWR